MIDEMTEDRLRVSIDGVAGPYLMVPMAQLDQHAIRYFVHRSRWTASAIAVINFGRAGDAPAPLTRPADGRAPLHGLVCRCL